MPVFLVCERCPKQPLVAMPLGETGISITHKNYEVELPINQDKISFGFRSYVNSHSLNLRLIRDALEVLEITFQNNEYANTLRTIDAFLEEHRTCHTHLLTIKF